MSGYSESRLEPAPAIVSGEGSDVAEVGRAAPHAAPGTAVPGIDRGDAVGLLLELHQAIIENTGALAVIAGELRPRSRVEDVDVVAVYPNAAATRSMRQSVVDEAVQIDNPYAVTLEARASSDGGGAIVMRVPPFSTSVKTVRVRELSLRALAAPAGVVPATVTRFDRPMQSGVWAYGYPAAVLGASAATPTFGDVIDRATRLLGRVSSGVADTLQAAGKVTAPAAAAAIATLAAPPAGVYAIEVDVNVSAGGADANNLKIQRGGVDYANPILVTNQNVSEHNYRLTLNGAQNVTVNAIAIATAGVVYIAQIIATRVE